MKPVFATKKAWHELIYILYNDKWLMICPSLQILEVLYDPNHIAIGNELLKLASILLSLGDCTAADSIARVVAIFSRYYGSHANLIFPHLQFLKKEVGRLH